MIRQSNHSLLKKVIILFGGAMLPPPPRFQNPPDIVHVFALLGGPAVWVCLYFVPQHTPLSGYGHNITLRLHVQYLVAESCELTPFQWDSLNLMILNDICKSDGSLSLKRIFIFSYSLWSLILTTLFPVTGGNFSVIHVDYVDFVPELGSRFWSCNL